MLKNMNNMYMKPKRLVMTSQLITTLIESEEESVYFGGLETFKIFHKKTKEFDFMKEILDTIIEEVDSFNSKPELKDDEEKLKAFDKNMKILKKMASFNLPKINKYFEKIILEGEMKTWKNEVMADCAKVFSVGMYKNGHLKTGLKFFIDKFSVRNLNKIKKN
jgi:hypothetical protein